MDDRLMRWMAEARVPIATDKVEARWQGVEAIGRKHQRQLMADLIRFYVVGPPTQQPPDAFLAALRKADPSLVPESALNELRVLAGVVARLAIEHKAPAVASAAAYGLVSAAFGRPNPPPCLAVFATDARTALARASEERRHRAAKPFKAEDFKAALTEAAKPAFAANNVPTIFDPLTKAFAAVAETMTALSERLAELDGAERAQREESNVLWWLLAEWSVLADKRIASLSANDACLILADELGSMIQMLPAPLAAIPVLLRLLGTTPDTGTSEIQVVVDASSRSWRAEFAKRPSIRLVEGVTPILSAIVASLATEEPRTWLPVFRKMCAVPADHPTSHEDLASQCFVELMYLKALDAVPEGTR